jgi:gluconate 2-dehydrogenase alpha chain
VTITLKETDAVVIGVGWTGSILARELTKVGLSVVGLERGARRMPREDFTIPSVRDDLKYAVRQELFQDAQLETVSLRHSPSETALPIRRLGSFLPGTDLGGAGAHWDGMTWRWLPSDHRLRSHLTERYGKNAIPEQMTIEDLPVSYDELEPYYDKFEKLCGVSGKAGNLRGKIIDGGNVFEGPRQNEYPNPPLTKSMAGTIMDTACRSLGYHPFQAPSSNASEVYTNFEGMTLGACEYCGHCERFGCEANAKASPNVCILPALLADAKFELRSHAQVRELVYTRRRAKLRRCATSIRAPARNTNSRRASSFSAPTCSTTCC